MWNHKVQAITRLEYPNHRGGGTNRPYYTQLVVDMVDAPGDINNGATGVDDRVNGYTMRQIEDALISQRTWNGWRDNIKNRYTNGTENNLDALFAFWN